MTDAVVSKQLLLQVASEAPGRFAFLSAVEGLLKIAAAVPCKTCAKRKQVEIPEALYRAILAGSDFKREIADLAGYLRADRLHVPGVPVPVTFPRG